MSKSKDQLMHEMREAVYYVWVHDFLKYESRIDLHDAMDRIMDAKEELDAEGE